MQYPVQTQQITSYESMGDTQTRLENNLQPNNVENNTLMNNHLSNSSSNNNVVIDVDNQVVNQELI